MIPGEAIEAAVEAAADVIGSLRLGDRGKFLSEAQLILSAALPFIQAQTLDEAVDAFPLETITAPDNAVVWMMRRAEEIRKRAG